MTNLSPAKRALLNPEQIKLIEAGYLNENLEKTPLYDQELSALCFEQHKEALLKKADEIIKEKEKK